MPKVTKDEVTLALDGIVTPSDFAEAARDLALLTAALSDEVAPGVPLDWTISGLDQGSALESVQCQARDPQQSEWVPRVVTAHELFAHAMESHAKLPFKSPVVHEVAASFHELVKRGRIIRVRFETAESGYTIAGAPRVEVGRPTVRELAYGAVRGRVQTISRKASLRFTLYDLIDGRAVYCYLSEGEDSEEMMRSVWGRLVEVEGLVKRDAVSGRALTVRRIGESGITELAPRRKYSAIDAIGAAPGFLGDHTSEDIIRRTREDG